MKIGILEQPFMPKLLVHPKICSGAQLFNLDKTFLISVVFVGARKMEQSFRGGNNVL